MVGHDRDVEPVAPARDEGGRADEAQRVSAQHIEGLRAVHAPDEGRQQERGHRPSKATADGQPMDPPGCDILWHPLAAREQQLDLHAQTSEAEQQLPLVRLPARGRLGSETAVGRADAHARPPHP